MVNFTIPDRDLTPAEYLLASTILEPTHPGLAKKLYDEGLALAQKQDEDAERRLQESTAGPIWQKKA